MKTIFRKAPALTTWISLTFALGLAGFALLGSFMRLSGDDYCYGGVVVQRGFWIAQVDSYTSISTYHGGRFSLTFFSGLATLLGPAANAILPGLILLVWAAGLALVLRRLDLKTPWAISLSLALVFCTAYLMPDRAQSLYWRSGMLPYTAPLAAGTWLCALVLAAARRPAGWAAGFRWVGIFALAVVAGGFSETAAAFWIIFWGLWTAAGTFLAAKKKVAWRSAALPAALALLGGLVALALLWLSPVTRLRQADLPTPPGWGVVFWESLRQAYFYTRSYLRLGWPACLALIVLFALAGWQARRRISLWLVPLGPLAGLALTTACMAPSFYAQSSAPDPRALTPAAWAILLGLAGLAWTAGAWLHGLDRLLTPSLERLLNVGLIAAALAAGLLPLWSARQSLAEVPHYRRWAQFWDARDQAIRTARSQGQTEIDAVQIDHIIPDVGELSPDENVWYNNCAEDYYDVAVLRADLPGWDR